MNSLKSHSSCQERLEAELELLRAFSGLGADLEVVWAPCSRNPLSGEVKEGSIYIYDENEQSALDTLYHEFFDYCVSKAIEPYKKVTNKLIALINEDAYKRKELVVEAIARLSKALAKRGFETIDLSQSE